MNVLVLRAGNRQLAYASCSPKGSVLCRGVVKDYRRGGDDRQSLAECVSDIWEKARKRGPIGGIGMEVAYGGREFTGPVIADPAVLEHLSHLASRAPLHVPVAVSLAKACRDVLPDVPVVLTFQTAFFAGLPERESSYGLDPELSSKLGLRRFGHYGLYHDAACAGALHRLREKGPVCDQPLRALSTAPPRIISICLDHQNELAAVVGRRPVLVTSGATPLEGLPGRTTVGQLDAAIVLTLSRELNWGPEQINRTLTQHSGLLGLTGRNLSMVSLFNSRSPALQPARELMRYRLLMASGSAVAAMGGVDEIILSGRYAGAGTVLGPWLCQRLSAYPAMAGLSWRIDRRGIERIISELTLTALVTPRDQPGFAKATPGLALARIAAV